MYHQRFRSLQLDISLLTWCEDFIRDPSNSSGDSSGSKQRVYVGLGVVCNHHQSVTDWSVAIDHIFKEAQERGINAPAAVDDDAQPIDRVQDDEGHRESDQYIGKEARRISFDSCGKRGWRGSVGRHVCFILNLMGTCAKSLKDVRILSQANPIKFFAIKG